ncbi:MAG: ankyrin repeat domain-containing protein, partial [Chlamydiae bacterium]|nr:ankyrin repeat domain-containing protein [Chlamydiota bacterium]
DNFNYLLKIGILNPHTQSSDAIYALFQLPASFLQSCIDRKFNFNGIKDQHGQTLLRELAQRGGMECLEKIQLLLKNGAQVNEKDSTYGRTPLMHAVEQKRKDVVRVLLVYGADPNLKDNGGRSAINLTGDNEMKKLLRDFGAKD